MTIIIIKIIITNSCEPKLLVENDFRLSNILLYNTLICKI